MICAIVRRSSDRPVLLGVWCHRLTVKCDPIDWFKLWHHRLTCYSLTWSGYHSHRRADQWISSLCGHRTQTSPPRSVIWPLTIKMKMRSVASVNLLIGAVQDDMGFLGLWSWRNFSDETEWVIIIPTIWSNQQSCHIRIWNYEWYTGIKICVFFWYIFLVISQSWRGALVGCWSGTGPAFALGWFMRQQ